MTGLGLANSPELCHVSSVKSWCLVTDIDGTLIGESDSTRELREVVLDARGRLEAYSARLRWVVATGRDHLSAREVLLDSGFGLDEFDALVTSVGAELYLTGEEGPNAEYHSRLEASGFDAALVRHALGPLALEPQPEHEQFPHKVSYYVTDTVELRRQVEAALAGLRFDTSIVFAMGGYLDVAPACGAKGGAVAHLLELWDLAPSRAVSAGDSGNDISMLDREWPAIVVGNGHQTLAVLRSRPGVYFAERKYAAGVLEGLKALAFV